MQRKLVTFLHEKKETIVQLLLYTVIFIVITVVATLFSNDIKTIIPSIGYWGPVVLILWFVLSHVVAPISGLAMLPLAYELFGVVDTIIYTSIAYIISSAICFLLSKRFGRPLVIKLAGSESMKQIDLITERFGIKFLIVARTVGASLCELVSYAAGFTKINFFVYMGITIVGVVINGLLFGLLLKDASKLVLYLVTGTLMVAGFVVGIFLLRKAKKDIRKQLTV